MNTCKDCEKKDRMIATMRGLIHNGVTANKNTRHVMDVLAKRAAMLRMRIAERKTNGLNASYDQAELSALLWAILFIETASATPEESAAVRMAMTGLDLAEQGERL